MIKLFVNARYKIFYLNVLFLLGVHVHMAYPNVL